MRKIGILIAGCLFAFLTCVGFSFAQEDKNEGVNAQEDKNEGIKSPSRQQSKPAAVKPEESKPDQPAQQEPSPGKPAHEDRHVQDQTKEQPRAQEKNAKQENKEQEEESKRTQKEQRNDQNDQRVGQEQNRNAGNGRASGDARKQTARIPEEKFRAHFGREHHFRVSQPVVVDGRPRFQSNGFWFEIIDVWPVGWSYSDDCYIDEIDGQYFLFDLLHPETRIAVVVVL